MTPGVLYETARRIAAGRGDGGRPAPTLVRTYELLALSEEVEVWAVHWPAGGALDLHGHGASAGAFHVARGVLREARLTGGGRLVLRDVVAGTGAPFGPALVHGVSNPSTEAAVSVHAYSPPLSSMTFYRMDPGGRLTAERTEYGADRRWTSDGTTLPAVR